MKIITMCFMKNHLFFDSITILSDELRPCPKVLGESQIPVILHQQKKPCLKNLIFIVPRMGLMRVHVIGQRRDLAF